MINRGRSLAHLTIQNHLKKVIPEAVLERSYPEIDRIADVAWEERKTIFEIQVSPISLQEAQSRCADYEKIGYTVIWILHDKTFNKKFLSQSELFLRSKRAFFATGTFIYDQDEWVQEGVRIRRGAKFEIDPLNLPSKQTLSQPPSSKPIIAFKKIKDWYGEFFYWLLESVSK